MPTGPGWRIGRILGIPIYLHSSWVFIFVLITFWLKESFAKLHSAWPIEQQWGVGIAASLLCHVTQFGDLFGQIYAGPGVREPASTTSPRSTARR